MTATEHDRVTSERDRYRDALVDANREVERLRAVNVAMAGRVLAISALHDGDHAALAALRAGIAALGIGTTPEMQALADAGRFRALWVNLRGDLRALNMRPSDVVLRIIAEQRDARTVLDAVALLTPRPTETEEDPR